MKEVIITTFNIKDLLNESLITGDKIMVMVVITVEI